MCVLLSCCLEPGLGKIAHNKKSIDGKVKSLNKIQEDFDKPEVTTITAGTTTELEAFTTGSSLNLIPVEDKIQLKQDLTSTTPINANKDIPSSSAPTPVSTTEISQDTTSTLDTEESSEDLSCTCGIFLNSQFTKGSKDPPKGEPVISNILDRNFPCNPIGQKQCQTKCLEQVQFEFLLNLLQLRELF